MNACVHLTSNSAHAHRPRHQRFIGIIACLFSLPSHFRRIERRQIHALITNEILTEYEEKLAEKTRPDIAQNVIRLLLNLPNVEKAEVWYRWNLITADADDNKYTDCAIAANAQYIVSDDAHFRVLKRIPFPKLELLTSDELLKGLLKKE